MDVHATLLAPRSPRTVFDAVDDLGGYPEWLEIVARAEPDDPAEGDPGPAWLVDLRGQIGPLRRSKRLRMVRGLHEPPRRVRFSRREVDGRSHSPWTLTAEVHPEDDGARLDMRLHYGGSLWVPLLDRLLREEIERSKPRLVARIPES